MNQKGLAPILIIILIAVALGGFVIYQQQNPQTQLVLSPQPITQPSPTPDETANWKSLSLDALSFKIPANWWSKEYSDSSRKWFNINPAPLATPSDEIPAFGLNLEKNKTVEQKKKELTQSWGFTEIKEESININGVTGSTLEGLSQPGFLGEKRMKIAFFQKSQDVYYLWDTTLLENLEAYFDQILSTFKFTD